METSPSQPVPDPGPALAAPDGEDETWYEKMQLALKARKFGQQLREGKTIGLYPVVGRDRPYRPERPYSRRNTRTGTTDNT